MKLTGMHAYGCIILAARYGVGLGLLYFGVESECFGILWVFVTLIHQK